MGLERRGRADQGPPGANPEGEEPRAGSGPEVKPFEIGKRLIYEAWKKVRANQGAPGVDAVSIGLFEQQWRDNLYKLWNRMSSGSYFPGRCGAWRYPKTAGRVCACSGCRRRRHSAAPSSDLSGSVVVTHPFHPLRGQRLEVLFVKRRGPAVVFVCSGGAGGQITRRCGWPASACSPPR
jgi:hypothetical protein